MKILLITPTSNQIVTFRKSLIEKFQSEGFQVFTIAFDDENRNLIENRGITHFSVSGANRSLNPLKIFTLKSKYVKIIQQVQPDVVFTFMLKPNIFGVRAARKVGVKKIFSMVEGAGDVFINNGLKWKIIRTVVCKMYRKSFRYANKVFFLNQDDRKEFIERKLVKAKQCEVIPGVGVDTEHFAYKPITNNRTFLMIARMLKTKGVIEYCRAARIVKQKYPDAVFNYLGAEGNIKVKDIQEYIDDGSINYLGTTKDVRPYLEVCSVFVLPTYREGFPVSVMEAMAVGRVVIASDTNGCRDAIVNQETGFLVPVGNINELADKIILCIEHPQESAQMGGCSRKYAEERFDKDKINEKIMSELGV